jgi:hypothetical protein
MIELPHLYHWSPIKYHDSIQKRGLRPTTPTTVSMRPVPENVGHYMEEDQEFSMKAVCLGTSPSTAWALSGAWSAEIGETWDLWQVRVMSTDEVHIRTEWGVQLNEVRVVNAIPRSQIWYVGSRTRKRSRWYA